MSLYLEDRPLSFVENIESIDSVSVLGHDSRIVSSSDVEHRHCAKDRMKAAYRKVLNSTNRTLGRINLSTCVSLNIK